MELSYLVAADPAALRTSSAPDETWCGHPGLESRAEVLVAAPSAERTRRLLSRLADLGHPVQLVFDPATALDRLLRKDGPAIALVDEAIDGARIVAELRAQGSERYVYVVLMVADGSVATKLAGREAGADDCITKPVESRELHAYLRAGQRIASMERRLVEARDRFRAQARRDPLTGLSNRMDIMDTLHREVSRSAREVEPVAVIMVDLDHFKRVNDTYGHPVGDDVIREAALRMNRAIRDYDCVGRYGGEEFLVVVSRADESVAATVATRLREAIAGAPFHTQAGLLRVTASLGVAAALGYEAEVEDLVGRADAALYVAKEEGRDRVVVAPTPPCVSGARSDEVETPAREAVG